MSGAHIAVHVIRLALAIGVLLAVAWSLKEPERHFPFAGASAFTLFLLAIGQLFGIAKDATLFLDGLALILVGVACGLILSESIRRRIAEKRLESAPANGAGQSL